MASYWFSLRKGIEKFFHCYKFFKTASFNLKKITKDQALALKLLHQIKAVKYRITIMLQC